MIEPEAEPTPSLIQRRHALRRNSIMMGILLASQVVCAVGNVIALIFDGPEWYRWAGAVVFTAGAIATIVQLRSARRATREFEERYGADAGLQK